MTKQVRRRNFFGLLSSLATRLSWCVCFANAWFIFLYFDHLLGNLFFVFFKYWLEAFISEVKWPEQFTNQASCHYCNDYYAHQEQNRHMYRVQHYRDRRKTARKTSSAAGLKLATLRSTLRSKRLFCLAFSSGWFSALVKLLIGRTPWRGCHFCGRGSNPAQSREYLSKQHRPHC